MNSFAIVTDDSAQGIFFEPGSNINLFTLHHLYPLDNHRPILQSSLSVSSILPLDYSSFFGLPTSEDLCQFFFEVNTKFDEVFFIGSAGYLSALNSKVEEIILKNPGRARYHLIDSGSISAGQGYLVNRTIHLIKKGIPPQKIEELIRENIPDIYNLICSPNLSFLHSAGFLDSGQLIYGEQQGIFPLYSLENGRVNPLEKCKNLREIAEYFMEFLEEYKTVSELCFIHPMNYKLSLFQEVKQYALDNLNVNSYTEHFQNAFMTNLVGPDGFGLVLIE